MRAILSSSAETRSPIRKRLWLAGLALGLFILTLTIGNAFLKPDKAVGSRMLGHDFLAFYYAGTCARLGEFSRLYDLQSIQSFEKQLAQQQHLELDPGAFGPYWNPPFYAWLFAPLSHLPYRTALALWLSFNLLALFVAMILLARMLPPGSTWRDWGLIVLLIPLSMPFIQALGHGQNTFTSLLLLSAIVTFWRNNRPTPAGLLTGLLFYKPQLAAAIALILILNQGRRALLGLAITSTLLLTITLLTMPGTLTDFLHRLPQNVHYMQVDRAYLWERHVTLKAFWRLLLQGRGPGQASTITTTLWLASSTALALGLLAATYQQTKRHPLFPSPREGRGQGEGRKLWMRLAYVRPLSPDPLIIATIAATPLLMPFYFDYDLLLLAIPAVLLTGQLTSPLTKADRWLMLLWIALFTCLMFNPALAGVTHLNVTVAILTPLAALLLRRAITPPLQPL